VFVLDEEYECLVEAGSSANRSGDVSGFAPPGDIHRVRNASDGTAISIHVCATDVSPDLHERSALLQPPGRARALGSLELGGQSEAGEDLGLDECSDLLDKRTLEREDVDRQR
jgi:hypothetical protein